MYSRPIPVVAACIVEGTQILLARRSQPEIPDAHLKWELPGGKIRFGETPEQAVTREIKEEVGCQISVRGLLPHLQTNIWETKGQKRHTIILCFESTLAPGQRPIPKSVHVHDVGWFNIDEIDYSSTLPGTREFISCLSKQPYATTLAIYVRLEKLNEAGRRLRFYEIYQMPTFPGPGVEIVERKGAFLQRRREETSVFHVSQRSALLEISRKLTNHVRVGYRITESQPALPDLRAALGI